MKQITESILRQLRHPDPECGCRSSVRIPWREQRQRAVRLSWRLQRRDQSYREVRILVQEWRQWLHRQLLKIKFLSTMTCLRNELVASFGMTWYTAKLLYTR
jgi:hypothetical protein